MFCQPLALLLVHERLLDGCFENGMQKWFFVQALGFMKAAS